MRIATSPNHREKSFKFGEEITARECLCFGKGNISGRFARRSLERTALIPSFGLKPSTPVECSLAPYGCEASSAKQANMRRHETLPEFERAGP